MGTRIIKGKLGKTGGFYVEYEQSVIAKINDKEQTFVNKVTQESELPINPDLYKAMQKLAIHVALLTEQLPDRYVTESQFDVEPSESDFKVTTENDGELIDITAMFNCIYVHPICSKITVTGFVIGGEDEHEGITFIAQRKLKTNKVLNLIVPFTKWEDEHSPYKFMNYLMTDFGGVIDEIQKYMNGKHGTIAQLELFQEEETIK